MDFSVKNSNHRWIQCGAGEHPSYPTPNSAQFLHLDAVFWGNLATHGLAPLDQGILDPPLRMTKLPFCIILQPAENITMIEQSNLHCN